MASENQNPLVDKEYRLQKFPGKGGWTYAAIPEVIKNQNTPFGWVRVRGSIDGYPLEKYKLAPMGNSLMFLPVKAEIRKKISKEAGHLVRVILFEDTITETILEELKLCFENEPRSVAVAFDALSEFDRNTFINWIYDAKSEDEKADRISLVITRLVQSVGSIRK